MRGRGKEGAVTGWWAQTKRDADMVGAHKAVTLRGSTRLKDAVIVEQEHLTLAGNIEISAGDGEV